MREAIDEAVLKALMDGRGISDFLVTRVNDGFGLSVRYTSSARWLPIRSRREPVRTWASLSAVGKYLERLGVREFRVEL
ncbi:hypothetical protein [Pseudomonas viridiflava]|uniref:hypothetical protein n=1 Tax=Pseudomonas viridiflava TaxID=33069 RepID=UPI000F034768|nr:hypothetical protein [Pseudomonas viridiflava]